MQRTAVPLIDLSVFRIPTFALGALTSGNGFRIVIGAMPLLWPLLFQVGFGMTAFASGTLIIACAAGDLTMKLFTIRLLRRFGFRRTLLYNGILVGLAVALCATFRTATPVFVMAGVLFAIGVVRSVEFGTFNALTYVDLRPEQMSNATSISGTLQQMSFGLGIAFAALLLHLTALWSHPGVTTYSVDDFRIAFLAAGALAIVAALGFGRLDPRAGAEASGHAAGTAAARTQKSPKPSPG
jgi:MFS family permease